MSDLQAMKAVTRRLHALQKFIRGNDESCQWEVCCTNSKRTGGRGVGGGGVVQGWALRTLIDSSLMTVMAMCRDSIF